MEQNTFNSNNIDAGSKIASFRVKQSMPYEFKVNYARIRAWEFYNECGKRDLDCYVSVSCSRRPGQAATGVRMPCRGSTGSC